MFTTVKSRDLTIHWLPLSHPEDAYEGETYIKLPQAAVDAVQEALDEDLDFCTYSHVRENYYEAGVELPTETTDVDYALSIIQIANEKLRLPMVVDWETEHICWLFHDISHIRKDVDEGEVYIDDLAEERALKDMVSQCHTHHIPIPWSTIATTDELYADRFGHTWFKDWVLREYPDIAGVGTGDTITLEI